MLNAIPWTRPRALPGWVSLVSSYAQTPFAPHRALARAGSVGPFVVALLVYLAAALLATLLFVGHNEREAGYTWAVYTHPAQLVALSQMRDSRNPSGVDTWVPGSDAYPIVLAADLLLVLVLGASFAIASRALLDREISVLGAMTAFLQIFSALAVLTLPLLAAPPLLLLVRDSSIGWLIWAVVLFVYLTIGLIAATRVTTFGALWLEALLLAFLPVWVVGCGIHVATAAVRKHDLCRRNVACLVILQPRAAFVAQRHARPARPVVVNLIVGALALLICRAVLFRPYPDALFERVSFPNLVSWLILFHKFEALYLYISAAVETLSPWEFGYFRPTYLSDLDSQPLTYLYVIVAGTLAALTFVAAVHLAVPRLLEAHGRFGHLLAVFLSIATWGTVFFLPWALMSLTTSSGFFMGLDVYAWWSVLLWTVVVHIYALQSVYSLSSGNALGAWFGTVLLFVPVTVVMLVAAAGSELSRPFRVRAARARIQRLETELRAELDRRDTDRVTELTAELGALYSDSSEIGRRARASVDLVSLAVPLFAVVPSVTQDYLLRMARSADPLLHVTAARALNAIADAFPEQVVATFWSLARAAGGAELLGALAALPDRPTPAAAVDLADWLRALLVELDESSLAELLARGPRVLERWRGLGGESLYLLYDALNTLREANTVVDIERAEDALVLAINTEDALTPEATAALRPLADISQYLTYYSRVDFENKVPYLAAPSMLLVDEGRKLERAAFPPEQGVLRHLVPHLQDIILREFDGLRGRAELRCELEPKQAQLADEVSLVLMVRNQGNAPAEQLSVGLDMRDAHGFSAIDTTLGTIPLLTPKREVRFEFSIRPADTGGLRIPFQISYDDLEHKGRQVPFAGWLELLAAGVTSAPQTRVALVNPYITGLPVKDRSMFFGRDDVFEFIRANLAGQHEKNILVLRGQRRTGKTSILYQLSRRLDEKYVPVILDMQGYVSPGADRFLHWIARGIAIEAETRGLDLPRPRIDDFRDDPHDYFRESFLPRARAAFEYRHILLAFDEFEELNARVEEGKLEANIFPFLRSLMQHTQLDFLFAGTHKLQQITHEYWSILFNIALFKDIGFMSAEEVEQVIRKPVKDYIAYDQLAIDKIMRITAGHPYFVQIIGNKLVQDYLEHGRYYFGLQDINRVLDAVLMGGALHFDYLWNQSSSTEQLLLAAMARVIPREGGAATTADITRQLERFDLSLRQVHLLGAVKSLLARELISTDDDFRRFEFKIDLVRLWLDRYQRFGVVAEAYREAALRGLTPDRDALALAAVAES